MQGSNKGMMSNRKPSGHRLTSSQPPIHQRTNMQQSYDNQPFNELNQSQNFINIHD